MRAYFLLNSVDPDNYRATGMKFLENVGVSTVLVTVEYGETTTFANFLPKLSRR